MRVLFCLLAVVSAAAPVSVVVPASLTSDTALFSSDVATWSSRSVPTSADDVVFDGQFCSRGLEVTWLVINGNSTFRSLTMGAPREPNPGTTCFPSSLRIGAGVTLTVTGNCWIGSFLFLEPNAQLHCSNFVVATSGRVGASGNVTIRSAGMFQVLGTVVAQNVEDKDWACCQKFQVSLV